MKEEQFYVDDFFSYELVKEVILEFEWLVPYKLIDNDLFVEIEFPNCIIELGSDGEGGDDFQFISQNGKEINLHPTSIFEVTSFTTSSLDLENRDDVWPNLNDTKKSIRNTMKILQAYFLPFINGENVDWLEDAINYK